MKKNFFIIFPIIILIFLIISLYFVNIPAPSKLVTEEYKIELE
tara:strand:- start:96 stop:224 length:129 start_codon:yes stop_codon:yes gene_type:complete